MAVEMNAVTKRYGKVDALSGLDLSVQAGEILALVGPNGAGKTTAIEILTGHRRRDTGTVSVLGYDPERGERALRQRMGVALQSCGIDPDVRVHEVLSHTAALYPRPRDVGPLVEQLGLEARRGAAVRTLSGGERRRLDLALAMVGDPQLLVLDEPTTGLDPESRHQAWHAICAARQDGTTVMLTSHAMDEVERWADRVTVIAGGQVVDTGTPAELAARSATEIRFRLTAEVDPVLCAALGGAAVQRVGDDWLATTSDPVDVLRRLTDWAHRTGHPLHGLTVQQARLEDTYLRIVPSVTLEPR